MRQTYQRGLVRLNGESSKMCALVGHNLSNAIRALLTGDAQLAGEVMESGQLLGELRSGAEAQALELMVLQAPVASDLRAVISALWIVGDLQRMGSLAIQIAEMARLRHSAAVVPTELRSEIEEMSFLSVHIAGQAGILLQSRDLSAVEAVQAEDAVIDDLQRQVFAVVLAPEWAHGVETAVQLVLLSRYLERFADHAVSVVKRVAFVVTGRYDHRTGVRDRRELTG